MKLYTLRGHIAGDPVIINKKFKNRDEAVDYMFEYSHRQFVFGMEVNDIVRVNDDKHNLVYLCNNNNDFNVVRIEA